MFQRRWMFAIAFGAIGLLGCSLFAKKAPAEPTTERAPPGGGTERVVEPTAAAAQPPEGAGRPTEAQPATGEHIHVGVQVEAMTAGTLRVVRSGEILRSGDRIALRVEVDQPAYLYVALAAANGADTVLFPRAGDVQLKPGAPVRIPPPGQWLALDRETGIENLLVYAAHRPLAADELRARLAEDAAAARAEAARAKKKASGKASSGKASSGAKPRPDPDEAPGGLTTASRGLEVVPETTAAPPSDDPNVSKARFTIDHRP